MRTGLETEIFYLRFLRALAELCEGLTWVTNWKEEGLSKEDNSKLLPLLRNSFHDCSNISFESFHRDLVPKGEDVIFSKELIKTFGANEGQFIRNSRLPSLIAPADLTAALRQRYTTSGKAIVGLAWDSQGGRAGKSVPLAQEGWNQILTNDGCFFVSLQYGDTWDTIKHVRSLYGVEIYQDPEVDIEKDLLTAAAQVNACDIIFTISTTAAHLAVAMNKKTILLLPSGPFVHWDFVDSYPNVVKAHDLSLDVAARELRRAIGLISR